MQPIVLTPFSEHSPDPCHAGKQRTYRGALIPHLSTNSLSNADEMIITAFAKNFYIPCCLLLCEEFTQRKTLPSGQYLHPCCFPNEKSKEARRKGATSPFMNIFPDLLALYSILGLLSIYPKAKNFFCAGC